MKRFLIITILVLCGCGAWAQTKQTIIVSAILPAPPQQPPLKCGQYQHVYHWLGTCGPVPSNVNSSCYAVCTPPPPDRCVDDMHEVSEREWQDLMARLKTLESSPWLQAG